MTRGPGAYAFFATVIVVAIAVHVYVYRRVTSYLGIEVCGRRVLAFVLGAAPALVVGSRIAAQSVDPSRSAPFLVTYASGFVVVIVVLMVAALLLPLDVLVAILSRRERAATDSAPAAPATDEPQRLSRRELLQRGAASAAVSIAGFSTLEGALVGRHDYELEEHPLPLANLSNRLDGYTIVQLSDLHLGPFVGEREMRAAIDLVRRAKPDLIVMTGDLLDHDPRYVPLLGELVTRLRPLARDGVVAIPGNHDYYTGIDPILSACRRADGRMLRNEGLVIGDARDGFSLLGVDDPWARSIGRPGPLLGHALHDVPPHLPRVLLAHQPVVFEKSRGRVDVQLSGHTHGGQISLGLNPAYLVLPHGWVRGFYEDAGSRLYVNRGFGTAGPPTRVGSPPEVTRFVLVAGSPRRTTA